MRAEVRVVAACLVILLVFPVVSGEPWRQAGRDAARTAWTPDPGPAYLGQAFELQMGGERAAHASPLIIDRDVYVLTREDATGNGKNALVRIALDTAQVETVASWRLTTQSIAYHDGMFYVVLDGALAGVAAGGSPLWTTELSRVQPDVQTLITCVSPAVTDTLLVVGCMERPLVEALPASLTSDQTGAGRGEVSVWAVDPRTGDELWRWDTFSHRQANPGRPVGDPFGPNGWLYASDDDLWLSDVVVKDDRVFVVETLLRSDLGFQSLVEGLDALDGAHVARFSPTEGMDAPSFPLANNYAPPAVAAAEGALYVLTSYTLYERDLDRLGELRDATLGPVISNQQAAQEAVESNRWRDYTANHLAVKNQQLLIGRVHELRLFDRAAWEPLWKETVRTVDGTPDLAVARDRAYFVAYPATLFRQTIGGGSADVETRDLGDRPADTAQGAGGVDAGAAAEGLGVWDVPPYLLAVGSDVLVAALRDGRIMVLGETGASIDFSLNVSDQYPRPGEAVTVNGMIARPGSLGGSIRISIDWGDFVVESVAPDVPVTHAYADAGDYEVEAWAVSDKGQDTKRTLIVHVGGTPPPPPHRPTFLEAAFSDRYQDTTWGIIGLIVVLVTALLTLWRRSILRREMGAIEKAAEATRGGTTALEHAMEERRSHIRDLLMRRKIEESQYIILERRINEIVRNDRLGTMEERLAFLPHGMAQTVRRMLADGHVSAWEEKTLADIVDKDMFLTAAQKQEVRRQLKKWREQDAG